MNYFRFGIAAIMIGCAGPLLAMGLLFAVHTSGLCKIELEIENRCQIGSWEVGGFVDTLLGIGIFGPIAFSLASVSFALWVFVEIAVLIAVALWRGRSKQSPTS